MPPIPDPGSSPRLRGKRRELEETSHGGGSIPAPAGETSRHFYTRVQVRVHPRACGGNLAVPTDDGSNPGPSPRLRGKQQGAAVWTQYHGSIPAPAGETNGRPIFSGALTVHPRACGGNAPKLHHSPRPRGPSPRLRGKRAVVGAEGDRRILLRNFQPVQPRDVRKSVKEDEVLLDRMRRE